jgi:hypothetical protein
MRITQKNVDFFARQVPDRIKFHIEHLSCDFINTGLIDMRLSFFISKA